MNVFAKFDGTRLERAVLGAILESNNRANAWDLVKSDFADPVHQHLFGIITEKITSGDGISPAVLAHLVMNEKPTLDETPLPDYCMQLAAEAKHATDGIHRTLKDLSARRQQTQIATNLQMAATDFVTPVERGTADAIDGLNAVMAARNTRKTDHELDDVLADVIAEIESGKSPETFTTGYSDVDHLLGGGGVRQGLTILAGRPAMFKSGLMQSSLLQSAKGGHTVMLATTEMPAVEIGRRVISDMAYTRDNPIPYTRIRQGNLSEHDRRRLRAAYEERKQLDFRVTDMSGPTIGQLAAKARAYALELEARGKRLDILAIDHIGHIKASGRYKGQKTNEMGEISAGLLGLAKDLDVCLYAVHQLNRAVESRDNKRPEMSDLRDSGNLEQDATAVLFVYRYAYYLARQSHDEPDRELERVERLEKFKHLCEVIVAKNRYGEVGTAKVFCDIASNVVRNLDYGGRS